MRTSIRRARAIVIAMAAGALLDGSGVVTTDVYHDSPPGATGTVTTVAATTDDGGSTSTTDVYHD